MPAVLIILALFVLAFLNGFIGWKESRDIAPVLPPGQTNPPLRKVGDTWPIPEGTPLWFKSNSLPSLTAKGTEDGHAIVTDRYGEELRIPRDYAESLLME